MKIRVFAAFLLCFSASQLTAQLKAGPFPVSENVMQHRLIHKVDPICPGDATRIDGQVVLKELIDESGKVENLLAVNGYPLLVPAAIDAVKQWRYKPVLVNGDPVKVETTIHLDFTCRRSSRHE
jgi:protein TonB